MSSDGAVYVPGGADLACVADGHSYAQEWYSQLQGCARLMARFKIALLPETLNAHWMQHKQQAGRVIVLIMR